MKFNKEPKGKLHVMTAGTDEDGVTYVFKEARFDSFEDMKKIITIQAAAPELLEALERARSGLAWYIDMCPEYADDSDAEALEEIDAAIKKATQCTK